MSVQYHEDTEGRKYAYLSPAGAAEQGCFVKRHNAYSLPYAFFVWLGDKPLAGPMTENGAEQSATAINAAIAKEREKYRISLAVNKDDCETDTNVRNLARPILGDFKVDGDSYGVPPLENITEELIKLLAAERVHTENWRKVAHDTQKQLSAEQDDKKLLIETLDYIMESSLTRGPEAICECFDKIEATLAKVRPEV